MSNAPSTEYVVEFERERHEAHLVAQRYVKGETTVEQTLPELQGFGSYGQYLSGELQVVHAITSREEVASDLLSQAEASFLQGLDLTSEEGGLREVRSVPKSQFRLLQLPILRRLIVEDRLPTLELAASYYTGLARFGGSLAVINRDPDNKGTNGNRRMVNHLMSTVAASILLTREGLKDRSTEEYFTFPTDFTEVNGGNCRTKGRYFAYDLATHARPGEDSHLEPVRKIHLVSNIAPDRELKVAEGLVAVVVNRDLKFKENDDLPSRNIIEEAGVELSDPFKAEAAAAKLDKRQDKLDAIIPVVH